MYYFSAVCHTTKIVLFKNEAEMFLNEKSKIMKTATPVICEKSTGN